MRIANWSRSRFSFIRSVSPSDSAAGDDFDNTESFGFGIWAAILGNSCPNAATRENIKKT